MVTTFSILLPLSLVMAYHGNEILILVPFILSFDTHDHEFFQSCYLYNPIGITFQRRLPMGGLGLLLFNILKELTLFYVFILLGEWFVQKKGYNLFERAWIITMIALVLLTFIAWRSLGRYLLFL
jgi:hypothetical protein